MKKTILLASLIILALSYSCVKDIKYLLPDTPDGPDPLNHPLPEIIWKQSLRINNATINRSINPIIFNDIIISSYKTTGFGNEVLVAFDKENGERTWEWSDFNSGAAVQNFKGDEKLYVHNDILLACSSQDDYAIDLNSGQTLWSSMIEHGSNNMSHFNELLFHTDRSGPYWPSDSSRILMSNIQNGQWSEVFTMHKEHGYEVSIDAPGVYIASNLDTLLLFQVQRYNYPSDQKVDLYCYNMTQDSVIWYKLDYTDYGFRNRHIPIIDGDQMYISAKEKIHCVDILSGDFIWTYTPSSSCMEDYQLYNGLFITFLGNGDLLALDKFSGSQVYLIEGLTGSPSTFSVYEDRLYYSDRYLFIMDVNTGEKLYTFQSPNGIYSFYNPPAIDLENNRMFISDKKDLYCLQVPE